MWYEGKFEIDDVKIYYKVKVFPDDYDKGVYGSNICKLWILFDVEDKYEASYDPIAYYDAGWIIRPNNKLSIRAVNHVIGLYKKGK